MEDEHSATKTEFPVEPIGSRTGLEGTSMSKSLLSDCSQVVFNDNDFCALPP